MNYSIEIDGHFFDCAIGKTVLQAMIGLNIECIPVGCCAGGCGICKVKVLEGSFDTKVMSRAKVSVEEAAQGVALACRILPKTSLKLERVKHQKYF